jgi:hypothetical protein
MVLAGGEDGSITVWDLRHNTFPVTLLSAHSDTGTAATKMKSCHIKNFIHHPSQLICYEDNKTESFHRNVKYFFFWVDIS